MMSWRRSVEAKITPNCACVQSAPLSITTADQSVLGGYFNICVHCALCALCTAQRAPRSTCHLYRGGDCAVRTTDTAADSTAEPPRNAESAGLQSAPSRLLGSWDPEEACLSQARCRIGNTHNGVHAQASTMLLRPTRSSGS